MKRRAAPPRVAAMHLGRIRPAEAAKPVRDLAAATILAPLPRDHPWWRRVGMV